MLTDQQRLFVNYCLEGKTQKDAFLKAYPHSKSWKDSSLRSRASQLLAEPKVRREYEKLKAEIAKEHKDKLLYTKEKAVIDLLWMRDKAKGAIEESYLNHANSTAFLNSIKELIDLEKLNEVGESETKEEQTLSKLFEDLRDEVHR